MFTFKQFKIVQANAAMKVCTDSCLFGALINVHGHTNVLDIGTGTGLLSLMLAQRNRKSQIDAVELDSNACIDAELNFSSSAFTSQLHLHNVSIQDFAKRSKKQYDLVISNPPFYENSLLSPLEAKNIAHHTTQLSLDDLLLAIDSVLAPNGKTWIILPPVSFDKFLKLAIKKGLFCTELTDIHHNAEKPCIRKIGVFEKTQSLIQVHKPISIRENKAYSEQYKTLLKDYYLIF